MNRPPESAGPAVAAPLWATLVATFFGAGRLKPGPGTWGSLATVIAVGVGQFADPGRKPHLGNHRRGSGCDPHRNPRRHPGRALFRLKRPAIRRHR